MKKGLSLLFSMGIFSCGNSLLSSSVQAQVAPDGTMNTTVNSEGNNFTIENGDRAGGNLFHSFQDFSVPNDGSAVFNNAPEIENIFSRVTGGNISNINGLIQANDANLFLVNPAGILFGENARLDIGGSFLGTTADSILFEDGEFSATDFDNPPLLTVNAPIGLSFRDNPEPIANSSSASADFDSQPSFDDFLFGLRVDDGKTFALAGGDITANSGGIVAVGGRIELGAVGESGTLGLNFTGDNVSFSFPEDLARANVSLTDGAGFLVAGNGGGDIAITANNINVIEGSGLFAGIFSGLGSPDAQAGNISLQAAESISLSQNSNINNNVGNSNFTATGNSGDIFISTQDLMVEDGSAVSVTTFGNGNAGNLNIQASNSVVISGETEFPGGLFAQVDLNGNGQGGNLTINTSQLSISDGSKVQVSTFGLGNAGNLSIQASEINVFEESPDVFFSTGIFAETAIARMEDDPNIQGVGNGEGGNIFIETDRLSVRNGGQISVSTFGVGNGGQLNINASDLIEVSGVDEEFNTPSSIRAEAVNSSFIDSNSVGQSGNVAIKSKFLNISEGGQISTSTFSSSNAGDLSIDVVDSIKIEGSNSGLFSNTEGTGDAGTLNIKTPGLSVRNGGQISVSTFSVGNGGQLNINASDLIEVSGIDEEFNTPSSIRAEAVNSSFTDSNSVGQSGNVAIKSKFLNISEGGQISTSTFSSSNAGDLSIDVIDSIKIEGSNSGLFSNTGGTGDAGTVNIKAPELQINKNAEIGVNNFVTVSTEISDEGRLIRNILEQPLEGSGNAGAINIGVTSISLEDRGNIVALSSGGEGGNIDIEASNLLSLKNNSEISATAGVESTPGNGGNIDIDSKFILAFPFGNNDITANSFNGGGGIIRIASEGIFGIRARPENNLTNDINADSLQGDGGNISIDTPDLNPIQGATELPNNLVTPEQTVTQACRNRGAGQSNSLVVKGKGGVPASPTDSLSSETITINGEPVDNSDYSAYVIPTAQGNIIPARGVIKTAEGQVILTAVPVNNRERVPHSSVNCG